MLGVAAFGALALQLLLHLTTFLEHEPSDLDTLFELFLVLLDLKVELNYLLSWVFLGDGCSLVEQRLRRGLAMPL